MNEHMDQNPGGLDSRRAEERAILRGTLASFDAIQDNLAAARDELARRLVELAEQQYTIPGQMLMTVDGGGVTRLVFLPHGGNAGYFGPRYETYDVPDAAAELSDETLDAMLLQWFTLGGDVSWEG